MNAAGFPSEDNEYFLRLNNLCNSLFHSKQSAIIDRPIIVLSPVYTGFNFGHDLSVILITLLSYRVALERSCQLGIAPSQLVLGVSRSSLCRSPNSWALLNYLIPHSHILDLRPDTVYYLENAVELPSSYFCLHREDLLKPLVEYIINVAVPNPIAKYLLHPIIKQCGGRFVLCKRASHHTARKSGIMPSWVEESLRLEGWYIIDPEHLSLVEIIFLLQHANHLLVGSGAIQYIHKTFANREAHVYLLFDS